MKTRAAFLAFLVLALLSGASVMNRASALSVSNSEQPTVEGGNYVGFFPSTFIISFPQTTVPNVTVHSLNNGLFTYTVSTTSPLSTVIIQLNGSDIYNVILGISYPVPISGNVTWELFSSGLPVANTGRARFSNDTGISLSWQLTLLAYPQYPTKEQIANATAGLLINYEQQNNAFLQKEVASNQAADNLQFEIQDVILGITVTFMSLVSMYLFRRRKD